MTGKLKADLALFLDSDLSSWLSEPYAAEPANAWSDDRKREYIAARVLNERRPPMPEERDVLGSFFVERLLLQDSVVGSSRKASVFAWIEERSDDSSWLVQDSAWSAAGLKAGDQVFGCDGQDVPSCECFKLLVCRALSAGEELQLILLRGGEPIELSYRPTGDVVVPSYRGAQAQPDHRPDAQSNEGQAAD
jgi:hypothetical protein